MMEVVKQDKLLDAANTEGIWDDIVAAAETYGSKYKIIFLWLLWLIAGLVFGVVWVDEWDSATALDFVLSSVSGGGMICCLSNIFMSNVVYNNVVYSVFITSTLWPHTNTMLLC